jgi:hypothetical protein
VTELKNALRSGDIWVPGSRQFKDFEDYLLPSPVFESMHTSGSLTLGTDGSFDGIGRNAKPSYDVSLKRWIH